MANEVDQEYLTDHVYDGIKEYDNPIPGWWNWLFFVSIVFSIFYYFCFHIGNANSILDDYEIAVAEDLRRRFSEIGTLEPDEQTILTYMQDDDWLKVGESVFNGKCAICHAADGSGGSSAPNLTDDHWLNVRRVEDIATVISEGVDGKGMPQWKTRLHPNEIVLTSAYIAKMREDGPLPGRKEEGQLIPAWPKLAADSGAADQTDPPESDPSSDNDDTTPDNDNSATDDGDPAKD